MKRYLTIILIGLSIVTAIFGITLDLYWSGMVSWGIVIILLCLAIYCTKYIPNDEKNDTRENK